MLYVERGNVAQVKRMVKAFSNKPNLFDINCMDPLGRTGLIIAIENENLGVIIFTIFKSKILNINKYKKVSKPENNF